MIIHRSKDPTANSWTATAPAKLNLFFEVHGKRTDGFHEITSVAVPIRLFDTIQFKAQPDNIIDFKCFGGEDDIPSGDDNIVVKALTLLRDRFHIRQGAQLKLWKRIPSQAGLGGGSSDAAAAMLLAKKAWKIDCSVEELRQLSAEIGSDCPIFFQNGLSLAQGRGEKIETISVSPKLYFVVMKPVEGLSTAMVYKNCMPCHDGQIRTPDQLISGLKNGNPTQIGAGLFNRLEVAAETIWPRYGEIRKEFERLDCLAVRMSGSGTAFYGLCRSFRHAQTVLGQLRQRLKKHEHVFGVMS